MLAGYMYPNTSEEITNAVDEYEKDNKKIIGLFGSESEISSLLGVGVGFLNFYFLYFWYYLDKFCYCHCLGIIYSR